MLDWSLRSAEGSGCADFAMRDAFLAEYIVTQDGLHHRGQSAARRPNPKFQIQNSRSRGENEFSYDKSTQAAKKCGNGSTRGIPNKAVAFPSVVCVVSVCSVVEAFQSTWCAIFRANCEMAACPKLEMGNHRSPFLRETVDISTGYAWTQMER